MAAAGGEVESVREIRPSFEEVFTALVERDRDAERRGRLTVPTPSERRTPR